MPNIQALIEWYIAADSGQSKRLNVLRFPSFYIYRPTRLFDDTNGNGKFTRTDTNSPNTYVSQPVSPHYETIGAFVISEEAIASFSSLDVAHLFKRKTIDGIQRS